MDTLPADVDILPSDLDTLPSDLDTLPTALDRAPDLDMNDDLDQQRVPAPTSSQQTLRGIVLLWVYTELNKYNQSSIDMAETGEMIEYLDWRIGVYVTNKGGSSFLRAYYDCELKLAPPPTHK